MYARAVTSNWGAPADQCHCCVCRRLVYLSSTSLSASIPVIPMVEVSSLLSLINVRKPSQTAFNYYLFMKDDINDFFISFKKQFVPEVLVVCNSTHNNVA